MPSCGRDEHRRGAGLLDGLPGPGQLDLLDALGGDEEGDLLLRAGVGGGAGVGRAGHGGVLSVRRMATALGSAPVCDNRSPTHAHSPVCRGRPRPGRRQAGGARSVPRMALHCAATLVLVPVGTAPDDAAGAGAVVAGPLAPGPTSSRSSRRWPTCTAVSGSSCRSRPSSWTPCSSTSAGRRARPGRADAVVARGRRRRLGAAPDARLTGGRDRARQLALRRGGARCCRRP